MRYVVRWMVAILLFGGTAAAGQTYEQSGVQSEAHLVAGVPAGSFGQNVDAKALGAAFFTGGRVPGLPFVLGTELAVLHHGSARQVELNRLEERLEQADFALPVSIVDVQARRRIAMGHLVARLQPLTGAIQPYLDALVGFKYFVTGTRIEGDVAFARRDLFNHSRFDDLALSYGAGGGIEVRFLTGPIGWDDRPGTLSMNVGARYLFGSASSYVADEALGWEGGWLTLATVRSRTDLVVPHLGVRVTL